MTSLTCGSCLIYATRSATDQSQRVKNLILAIKTDQVQPISRRSYAAVVVEAVARRLTADVNALFSDGALLVPVPRSGLTKPKTVWPALRLCEELVTHGLGTDILPALQRTSAVTKSAGSADRPTLAEHFHSLSVQPGLCDARNLLLVDDVVTTGTTLMAAGRRLESAFSRARVAAFSLARVLSAGDPPQVVAPIVESIVLTGPACRTPGHDRPRVNLRDPPAVLAAGGDIEI